MFDKLRMHGVTFANNNLNNHPANEDVIVGKNFIGPFVIRHFIEPKNKLIENTTEYKEFRDNTTSHSYNGPYLYTIDNSPIFDYLFGRSRREGLTGKLAGIIYRVLDAVRGFWSGRSDKIKAHDSLKNFLTSVKKLKLNKLPSDHLTASEEKNVHTKTKKMLNEMVKYYNQYV